MERDRERERERETERERERDVQFLGGLRLETTASGVQEVPLCFSCTCGRSPRLDVAVWYTTILK